MSSPCENGGSCIDVNVDTYLCMCRDRFFGATCDKSNIFLHVLNLGYFKNKSDSISPELDLHVITLPFTITNVLFNYW